MKMSYRQDNLNRGKKIKFYALVVVAVSFFFFSGFILIKSFDVLSVFAVPIWSAENRVKDGVDVFVSFFRSKQELEEENRSLKQALENMQFDLSNLSLLKQQNEELFVQMGRELTPTASSTIAAVLSGPNLPPYDDLIIDAGSNEGVSVGDRVISEPNIMLGEVASISNNSSKVKLYSASGVLTDVIIPTSQPMHVVATGYGGGTFNFELSNTVLLQKGMQLMIPGTNIYILGTIDNIEPDIANSSQKIMFKYPINLKNLKFVHVIKESVHGYLQ